MMTSLPLWVLGLLLLIVPLRLAWALWLRHRAGEDAIDIETGASPPSNPAPAPPGERPSAPPRARPPSPARPPSSSHSGPSSSLPSRPPRQQYLFAHFLLRMTARGDPEAWLALRRANQDAERLLAALWAQAGFFYGSPFEMRPKDVLVARGGALPRSLKSPQAKAIPGGVLVLVPVVTTIADAYAIAIFECGDELRYYTLEKGEQGDFFCEWQSDGSHHNRGPASGDDIDAFVARARREVDRDANDDDIEINAPGGAA